MWYVDMRSDAHVKGKSAVTAHAHVFDTRRAKLSIRARLSHANPSGAVPQVDFEEVRGQTTGLFRLVAYNC